MHAGTQADPLQAGPTAGGPSAGMALAFDFSNDGRDLQWAADNPDARGTMCAEGAVGVNHDAWMMYRAVAIMSYAVPGFFACTSCCHR